MTNTVDSKKICKRCGHPVCPSFGDWCDVILYSPEDQGCHIEGDKTIIVSSTGAITFTDYPKPCCGGECVYDDEQ